MIDVSARLLGGVGGGGGRRGSLLSSTRSRCVLTRPGNDTMWHASLSLSLSLALSLSLSPTPAQLVAMDLWLTFFQQGSKVILALTWGPQGLSERFHRWLLLFFSPPALAIQRSVWNRMSPWCRLGLIRADCCELLDEEVAKEKATRVWISWERLYQMGSYGRVWAQWCNGPSMALFSSLVCVCVCVCFIESGS